MKVELGSIVKDKITGLQGVVMARTTYLTGCAHLGIQPQKLKTDGTVHEWVWIDETRAEVKKGKIKLERGDSGCGGNMPNAPTR